MKRLRRWLMLFLAMMSLLSMSSSGDVRATSGSSIADLVEDALPAGWSLAQLKVSGDDITVCLDTPMQDLRASDGLGIEVAVELVRYALTPVEWRRLAVQVRDPVSGVCRSVSDFAPRVETLSRPLVEHALGVDVPEEGSASRSLVGKTVYVSAGHGWQWTGSAWRTQRVVYQGFIEDHNNAEAVDQYLIRYLENAGAKVIPVRERDWNAGRAISDNGQGAPAYTETGVWSTGTASGYAGSDRYAISVVGQATATATWLLQVPADGHYAVYAWVRTGSNRVRDAHYRVMHTGGTTDVYLDQRIHPQTWRYLGTYPFRSGTAQIVLDNLSSEAGRAVMADAVRLGGGLFDSLSGITTSAPSAPQKPWWESATVYYSQWMGLNSSEWACYNYACDFNDVVSRPMFSRWYHTGTGEDAVYISWHTNGYNGTARGTESYVHNGETYPRTEGSWELGTAVHSELISDIRAGWDPAWTNRGLKQANLGELRLLWDDTLASRMPGVLLEIAFHDHVDDANALKDPRFNQLAARAIYQGIVKYFEGRDGRDLALAPEPPTHLSVRNAGNGRVLVDWMPSPTDGVGLRGDAATGYRVYTSPDGFSWSLGVAVSATEVTLQGLNDGQKLYVRVTATNDGGESFPTEVLGARVGPRAHLLIVNGFDKLNRFGLASQYDAAMGWNLRMWLDKINRRSYVVHHGDAVPLQYVWDSASNEAIADGLVDLNTYGIVDWVLGEEATEEDGTLNSAERSALQTYLAGNGALLISGTDLAWDLGALGRAPDFLSQILRVSYVTDDANTYAVAPVAGRAFDGLPTFTFDAPEEYDADYPDVISGLNGAVPALVYSGGYGGTAAIQYASGCSRLLVLGFPFETVRSSMRSQVMLRALDFLDECVFVDTTIVSPLSGAYYKAAPVFQGTAMAPSIAYVEIQLQRGTTYWSGLAWGSSPIWLRAVGTLNWSYELPALNDGGYSVRARAVGDQTDLTPAEVAFGVDSVPPQTPTLITPTGGVRFLTPLVPLTWSQPADSGSPLVYRLEVNDRTYVASASPYLVGLPSGLYVWRVRTEDAAGNISGWSPQGWFEVEAKQAYLPLIMQNR